MADGSQLENKTSRIAFFQEDDQEKEMTYFLGNIIGGSISSGLIVHLLYFGFFYQSPGLFKIQYLY